MPDVLGSEFIGNGVDVREFLKSSSYEYYTYALHRPDGVVFYIGQGKYGPGRFRILEHAAEARKRPGSPVTNPYKVNRIRKIWREGQDVTYRIDAFHEDRDAADRREIYLIAAFGRASDRVWNGGTLTNLTAGGGGGSDPSPVSREKHRQTLSDIPNEDGDRRTINLFMKSVEEIRGSIGIKPESEFSVVFLTPFTDAEKKVTKGDLTKRAAVVLGVSAIANGIVLEPGCQVPRRMVIDGVEAAIENGVGRRILATETCKITYAGNGPGDEIFHPNQKAISRIIEYVGAERLIAAGVLDRT